MYSHGIVVEVAGAGREGSRGKGWETGRRLEAALVSEAATEAAWPCCILDSCLRR